MAKISFLSTEQGCEVTIGVELLTIFKNNPEMPLKFGCTKGDCGVCLIKLGKGKESLSPPTQQEKLILKDKFEEGYRLACQCAVLGDIEII